MGLYFCWFEQIYIDFNYIIKKAWKIVLSKLGCLLYLVQRAYGPWKSLSVGELHDAVGGLSTVLFEDIGLMVLGDVLLGHKGREIKNYEETISESQWSIECIGVEEKVKNGPKVLN